MLKYKVINPEKEGENKCDSHFAYKIYQLVCSDIYKRGDCKSKILYNASSY